jgi:hypothetical protein
VTDQPAVAAPLEAIQRPVGKVISRRRVGHEGFATSKLSLHGRRRTPGRHRSDNRASGDFFRPPSSFYSIGFGCAVHDAREPEAGISFNRAWDAPSGCGSRNPRLPEDFHGGRGARSLEVEHRQQAMWFAGAAPAPLHPPKDRSAIRHRNTNAITSPDEGERSSTFLTCVLQVQRGCPFTIIAHDPHIPTRHAYRYAKDGSRFCWIQTTTSRTVWLSWFGTFKLSNYPPALSPRQIDASSVSPSEDKHFLPSGYRLPDGRIYLRFFLTETQKK